MSEPEIKIVDIKDLKTEVSTSDLEFDNDIKRFGSQLGTSSNVEHTGSFSNSIDNLTAALIDMESKTEFAKNLRNIGQMISNKLTEFNLLKTLKVNTYKILDENDRYTRASFTMNNESAVERIDQETGSMIVS